VYDVHYQFKSIQIMVNYKIGKLLLALLLLVASCKDDTFEHNPSSPIVISSFLPAQGSGGTEILINGANFAGDTSRIKVMINGVPLRIIGVKSDQLMAVVPKGVGTGPVTIKIGENQAQSEAVFSYTYTRTVTTLAGSGEAGFANGKGAEASFNFSGQNWYRSSGIVVDDQLNVYVADPGNHCIRKIDSAGNVTTLAGDPGQSGFVDGKGSKAHFSLPYSLAIDPSGNLYTADPGNGDIRRISPDGTAVTWAMAKQEPWSVAFDKKTGMVYYSSCNASGNIYPVKQQNVTGDPIVSGLLYPAGIAFDDLGNLYASLNGEQVIRNFSAGTWQNKILAGQAGTSGYVNGAATAARFSSPWGLAVDTKGNVYVAGNGTWDGGAYNADQSIRLIQSESGLVSTFAGSGVAGYADSVGESAAFSAPTGVAVDKNGTVYVLDKINNRVRKIVSE
jgi:sugar lactone lactonase YvrE